MQALSRSVFAIWLPCVCRLRSHLGLSSYKAARHSKSDAQHLFWIYGARIRSAPVTILLRTNRVYADEVIVSSGGARGATQSHHSHPHIQLSLTISTKARTQVRPLDTYSSGLASDAGCLSCCRSSTLYLHNALSCFYAEACVVTNRHSTLLWWHIERAHNSIRLANNLGTLRWAICLNFKRDIKTKFQRV